MLTYFCITAESVFCPLNCASGDGNYFFAGTGGMEWIYAQMGEEWGQK